jgi:hypothetical protein
MLRLILCGLLYGLNYGSVVVRNGGKLNCREQAYVQETEWEGPA